jgi:hypothetical protein
MAKRGARLLRVSLSALLMAAGFAFGAGGVTALAADGITQKSEPAAQPGSQQPGTPSPQSAAPQAATSTAQTKAAENPHSDPNNKWGFFEQYCEKCHNSTDWAGGVAYDTMSQDSIDRLDGGVAGDQPRPGGRRASGSGQRRAAPFESRRVCA